MSLDAQAERQRRRAPEPEPELRLTHEELRARSDREVAIVWAAMIPLAALVILGVALSAWVFWIGLLVLCAAMGAAIGMGAE